MSRDGAPPVAAGRTLFKVIAVGDRTALVQDSTGFSFNVQRVLPQIFEGSVVLEVGQRISGVLDHSTLTERVANLMDALVEDGLKEREEFEGAPETISGWQPGIATNLQKR
jgi:hypothetical protein